MLFTTKITRVHGVHGVHGVVGCNGLKGARGVKERSRGFGFDGGLSLFIVHCPLKSALVLLD